MHANEEWVSLWYQCLSANQDYIDYCNAIKTNDKNNIKNLENKFDKLSEIYSDFGEIEMLLPEEFSHPIWNDWFELKRHLFTPPTEVSEVKVVHDPFSFNSKPNSILIDLPLANSQSETVALVSNFISEYYSTNHIPPSPKYQLMTSNGKPALKIDLVRQACVSVARYYNIPPDSDSDSEFLYSMDESFYEFIRHEFDNMRWSSRVLSKMERDHFMRTNELKAGRFESIKAQINTARNNFIRLSANTIRGRFPDNSKFDSRVYRFWKLDTKEYLDYKKEKREKK